MFVTPGSHEIGLKGLGRKEKWMARVSTLGPMVTSLAVLSKMANETARAS